MEKKIICILVSMLMCTTALAVAKSEKNNEITECVVSTIPNTYPLLAPGDILIDFDVQTPTGDTQCLGGEWDGNYFWVTGGAAGTDPNKLYKFDIAGNLLNTYNQPSAATGWGIRDLAFDGAYLYGGSEYGFWKIDPADGTFTLMFSSISPMTCIRALAWVPSEGMFYSANFGAPWYKFTPDGSTKIPISNPGLTGEYGMAYDDLNDTIWVFDQIGTPGTVFHEYNYHTQSLTGKQWVVPLLIGATEQIAGGAFYATDIVSGKATLGGVTQGTPVDRLFVMEIGTTNYPPNTPEVPDGPSSGRTGAVYTFSSTTTDPEDDDISIRFDWGDGMISDWSDYYPSGSTISGSHTWPSAGTFEVKAQAKDINGGLSAWSDPHEITIVELPDLQIRNIGSKFGRITVDIKNIGTVDVTDIKWTISLEGGLIILGRESEGTVPSLKAGFIADFESNFIFGFGKPTVTVKLEVEDLTFEKTVEASVFFFFVKIT